MALALVAPVPKSAGEQAFEAWWDVYPSKVAKKKARTLFFRILKRGEAHFDDLMAGAQRYAKSDQVARGYIKHPTTWLNYGCWADQEPIRPRVDHHGGFGFLSQDLAET